VREVVLVGNVFVVTIPPDGAETSALPDRPPDRHEQARRLGLALAALRRAAGLDVRALAQRSGVSETSVRGWEDGRQLPKIVSTARLLTAIAAHLDPASETAAAAEVEARARRHQADGADHVVPAEGAEPILLDVALRDWVVRARKSDDAWVEPLLERLGWAGTKQLKLDEAGAAAGGKSRQAAKQQEDRLHKSLLVTPPPLRELDRAASCIWDLCPTTTAQATDALLAAGMTSKPISIEGLLDACHIAGLQDLPVVRGIAVGTTLEEAQAHLEFVDTIEAKTRTPTPLPVTAVLEATESDLEEPVRALLETFEWIHWLADDWFVDRSSIARGSPLVTNLKKLMAGCGPLGIDTIIRGLRSVEKRGRLHYLPPPSVLERFVDVHPEFDIRDGIVAAVADFSDSLAPTEKLALETIRRAGGAAKYAELKTAFEAAGFTEAAVGQLTLFSPVLMRRARDEWVARSDGSEFTGRAAVPSSDYAERLRRARIRSGLSQQALAERVGVDQPTVSTWETARVAPPNDMKRALEDVLALGAAAPTAQVRAPEASG
jgi:transcriptional regulator with XRE-family HTH domain